MEPHKNIIKDTRPTFGEIGEGAKIVFIHIEQNKGEIVPILECKLSTVSSVEHDRINLVYNPQTGIHNILIDDEWNEKQIFISYLNTYVFSNIYSAQDFLTKNVNKLSSVSNEIVRIIQKAI